MDALTRHHPDPARAAIARALAQHYDELAGADGKPAPRFSLARALQEAATEAGLRGGYEAELCHATAQLAGEAYDSHRLWVPLAALQRAMTATGASGSQYLVGTATASPLDALRPWSVVAQAGVTLISGLTENLTVPRVTTKSGAAWLSDEGVSQTSDAQPVLGTVSLTPKNGAAHIAYTRQFRVQAEASEQLMREQLLRGVGELIDGAFFAGAGNAGAPSGLLITPNIGTQSGSTLGLSGLLAMRDSVLDAGAREDMLRWVGHPGVQQTLGAREAASGSGFLWQGRQILDAPAHATKNAPASTLVCGDFSTAIVGMWGPPALKVEVDPFSGFKVGHLRARVIVSVDFAFPIPAAFNVATSVT